MTKFYYFVNWRKYFYVQKTCYFVGVYLDTEKKWKKINTVYPESENLFFFKFEILNLKNKFSLSGYTVLILFFLFIFQSQDKPQQSSMFFENKSTFLIKKNKILSKVNFWKKIKEHITWCRKKNKILGDINFWLMGWPKGPKISWVVCFFLFHLLYKGILIWIISKRVRLIKSPPSLFESEPKNSHHLFWYDNVMIKHS